ncbi:MAG: DMT family transporter [Bacteroidota bacterium]
MKAWKAELALLSMTFIWGGTFTFTKLGIQDVNPSLYIILRFVIAFILSIIIFGKYFKNISPDVIRQGLILGFFFGGGFLLQTYGLKFTSVTKSAFITGLAVPLVPFVYKLVEKKLIGFWSKVGVVIATIGLWIFTDPELDTINLGDILTLASTLFWAFYITYMDVFTRGRTEFAETAQFVILQFIGAAALCLVFFLLFELHELKINPGANLYISLAFNGIMASFLVTFIHTAVQKYTTPVKAGLIFSLEPVVASIIAVIVFSEIMTIRGYTGAVILLCGVLASELGSHFFSGKKHKIY